MMSIPVNSRRLSVAPMLDWTDRHYRYLARQITKKTWLYSEMIHANAIVYGDTKRFLYHHADESPVALQLGGSDPHLLAQACKMAQAYDYDEINLNCGCPSPKVQKGAFGACLMREVGLVADCLNAMQEAVPDLPITIKHRIGLDDQEDYQPLADFVGTLRQRTACRVFVVHARNAWLEGLSPRENREIPPLRYDLVYRLKREFPDLTIIINGGIVDNRQIVQHLNHVDGVMVGRASYHQPMLMKDWDNLFYHDESAPVDRAQVVESLYQYAVMELASGRGTLLRHIVRPALGLMHGWANARIWRKMLSDGALLCQNDPNLILNAWHSVMRENDEIQ